MIVLGFTWLDDWPGAGGRQLRTQSFESFLCCPRELSTTCWSEEHEARKPSGHVQRCRSLWTVRFPRLDPTSGCRYILCTSLAIACHDCGRPYLGVGFGEARTMTSVVDRWLSLDKDKMARWPHTIVGSRRYQQMSRLGLRSVGVGNKWPEDQDFSLTVELILIVKTEWGSQVGNSGRKHTKWTGTRLG